MNHMNDTAYELRQKLINMERPVRTWHWLITGVVVMLAAVILSMPIWAR